VTSNQKVPLFHAHSTPLRLHIRRHIAQMPLVNEQRVNINVRLRHFSLLSGYVSTNKCTSNVGCSCHTFELNCGAPDAQFFSCATIAFSERYVPHTNWQNANDTVHYFQRPPQQQLWVLIKPHVSCATRVPPWCLRQRTHSINELDNIVTELI